MANYDSATYAQNSVIGSMLIDDRCVPLVLSKLREDDFIDPICRNFFRAIRELALENKPVDPVVVMGKLGARDGYVQWAREVMELTPTAANVASYIPEVRRAARRRTILELADRLPGAGDDELETLVRKMSAALSATERMPRMTASERAGDFFERMKGKDKPRYLPWGIPTADRAVFAQLGDMILLGGYASSGKTLLSIAMAMAQAKAGYRVGYYSLETSPQKMMDRQIAALAQVPLGKIKQREFFDAEWSKLAGAVNYAATTCPFDVIQAAGSAVDDIAADAIGHGYQVIYVDYVQLVQAPGVRATDRYAVVTAVSQGLKTFAQSTHTAVVALAQLSRPEKSRDKAGKPIPPSMHSFRESGQLEQDADAAFLVYPSNPDDNTSNRIFKIGKNKEGPRAKAELAFRGDTQTMVELEPAPDRSVAAELSAKGRAVKQANRAMGQVEFRELKGDVPDNPFV
jgi:replicative DNA helicase